MAERTLIILGEKDLGTDFAYNMLQAQRKQR